jgi:hypothetical protein
MNMEQRDDDDDHDHDVGGIPKQLEKTWPIATLPTKNPKWTGLELNPGPSEMQTNLNKLCELQGGYRMSPVARVMQSNRNRALALYKYGRVAYEHWVKGVLQKEVKGSLPLSKRQAVKE